MRLGPTEIDVTSEVVSTDLGGLLLERSGWKMPLDDMAFSMANASRGRLLLCLQHMRLDKEDESGELTSTLLDSYDVDIDNAYVGNLALTTKEITPLRAAYRSVPPRNWLVRQLWSMRRSFDEWMVHMDFHGLLSLRELHMTEEKAAVAVKKARRGMAVWSSNMSRRDFEIDVVNQRVIDPLLARLDLVEDEARFFRSKLLRRLGYLPSDE